jgi:hypothetical protein
VAGWRRVYLMTRLLVTAAALAAGMLIVQAADLALAHIDEVDAVAATHGFRTIYTSPAS